ncbi:MAG: hypothetical protein EPN55_02265 [Gammaproteobacteria bacterium]|nr:MAG: hypothetical protein EPN55_02265 [Gammaproteobacteria bacterium]
MIGDRPWLSGRIPSRRTDTDIAYPAVRASPLPASPGTSSSAATTAAPCFYAEEDYRRYLDTLQEQAQKFKCVVHAYVLMTKHVHLLLTPWREDSAARFIKTSPKATLTSSPRPANCAGSRAI